MRLFRCQSCDNVIYFENRVCGQCGRRLGYLPEMQTLAALEPASDDEWTPVGGKGTPRRFCLNAEQDACNWLATEGAQDGFCLACRHNGAIPEISSPENLKAWRALELAKHRLFYSLLRWGLPLETRVEDPSHGLIFKFLADPPASGPKIMTGHDNGIITIALAEADDVERERRRSDLAEPYRTLLGHFRHEVGHHFWDILVRDGGKLDAFRARFGDERQDYGVALARHYEQGPPSDWQDRFVSTYATSHPWEDFAETWSHYLHIVDTLETAAAFGMRVEPPVDPDGSHTAKIDLDPYAHGSMQDLMDRWTPFVIALNSINRAMGRADLYPFVLAPAVIEKLGFMHELVRGSNAADFGGGESASELASSRSAKQSSGPSGVLPMAEFQTKSSKRAAPWPNCARS
ncbi:MAG: putative zinc-binding peptidase [Hyphomicrobiales bacterium]|nr:putative zinc-binding peptidase [Hyphomicrobiales bacterium]